MESSIEEQLRDKEAVQAENAAQQALIQQHEAEVRARGGRIVLCALCRARRVCICCWCERKHLMCSHVHVQPLTAAHTASLQSRAVAERTAELQAKHGAAVAALLARYRQLRAEVAAYNGRLESVMASGPPAAAAKQQQRLGGGGAAAADALGGRDQGQ